MKISLSSQKKASINPYMMGLFFEDINYAADGGLYAEMIENRSFEFVEAFGDKEDYYTKFDGGYGWNLYPETAKARMEIVSGSPMYPQNPHYLRFTAKEAAGISNQAYRGVCLQRGWEYRVKFYARTVSYEGKFEVKLIKDGRVCAGGEALRTTEKTPGSSRWEKYELSFLAEEDAEGALFVLALTEPGTVEFDFVSMMPANAVAGVFRRDLFEKLKELKPGFLRFPGGCIVEGNTLENRYRPTDTLAVPEARRSNWNRWAVHNNCAENGYRGKYSHYNQTCGLGYYEYFLLCELLGAKPLPVFNVGMACQYQSKEWVDVDDPQFETFLQEVMDVISFANGGTDTYWGAVRARLGHPEPFGLELIGIGNEQWQVEESDFFTRYRRFEERIHAVYPQIRLIGSAGPDVTSDHYREAWAFYDGHREEENFVFAVDEHYYVRPEWFYANTDFYDRYPRDRRVFSGEYAAHPADGANTLAGALAEAAFLTGVERNADVVVLSSYAPLFARHGFWQWRPDLIWFDEKTVYGTPSFYVQKMYSNNMGTAVLDPMGREKEAAAQGIYYNASEDEASGEVIVKIVNRSGADLPLTFELDGEPLETLWAELLGGKDPDADGTKKPDAAHPVRQERADVLPDWTFAVYRLKKQAV